MTEADLNRMISNSLAWGYKIPDPPQVVAKTSSRRPFDGFGFLGESGIPIYWEAKLLKGYASLPFSRVAPHQLSALKAIKELGRDRVEALILVGVHIPYHGVHLFSFDILFFDSLIQAGQRKSIAKEQFKSLANQNVVILSNKEQFILQDILQKRTIRLFDTRWAGFVGG